MSFVELMLTQKKQGSTRVERIGHLIRWERFRYRLNKIVDRKGLGRPPYDILCMFKATILQHMYALSDVEMEEMLYDRLSFRRFCGFSLEENLPDETTLCRFRNLLSGHGQKLMDMVMEELKVKGLNLKKGVIVDATLIESRSARPKGGEVSGTDPEAGWTKKRGQYVHGYKVHASVDAENGLIQSTVITSADIHDSLVFGTLLSADDGVVYADKAYGSAKNRKLLKDHGLEDCLLYKGGKNRPIRVWQKELNKSWNKVRSGVERTFAHLKGNHGWRRTRYFGLESNETFISLSCIAYNLRRAEKILRPPTSITG